MPDNKSDDCQSCDMCEHEFEAKPEPLTPGEEWVREGSVTSGGCCLSGMDLPVCEGRVYCHICKPHLAEVYDIGDSNGYARGTHDERAHAAQYEALKNKPKPAMSAEEWWKASSIDCMRTDCRGCTCKQCHKLAEQAVESYRKLNKGRIIT